MVRYIIFILLSSLLFMGCSKPFTQSANLILTEKGLNNLNENTNLDLKKVQNYFLYYAYFIIEQKKNNK